MLMRPVGVNAAHPGRGYAVEQVDSSSDSFDDVFGKSNSHEVARPVLIERAVDDVEHLVHGWFCFANGKPADCESFPVVHRVDCSDRFQSQACVNTTLDDRKQCLRLVVSLCEFIETPLEPPD